MKNSIVKIAFFIFCIGFLLQCKSEKQPSNIETTTTSESNPEEYITVPEITQSFFDTLVSLADHTDIIFYNYPISLSQDQKKDIHTLLGFFQKGPVKIPKSCKPDADIIFLEQGIIIADGKFYISQDGCRHIVFLKDNKPYCGVNMNDQGVNFYRGVLNSHRID